MRTLPAVMSTSELRGLEADWIKRCGGKWSQVLMEIAGRAAAEASFKIWQQQPGPVAIVCGRGNNGGDGFVVARYLKLWGAPVRIFVVPKSEADTTIVMSSEESSLNKKIAEEMGIETSVVGADFKERIAEASLIVDAMLGTGIDRAVEGTYKFAIDAINQTGHSVVAVDLPSGINSDTGHVMGAAVKARRTITFGYLKSGLLQHPGAAMAGDLSVVDIGLPDPNRDHKLYLTTGEFVRTVLPKRPEDSHKGTFGAVMMIGGSTEMFGATVLSSRSALRTGAGLCMLAAPKSVVPHLPAAELIYKMLPETDEGSISADALKTVEKELEKMGAVVLGPGMSQNAETAKFVYAVLDLVASSDKPCVIDADALNAISLDTAKFPKNGSKLVLTPHPKELSRLMQNKVSDIQKDRIASARAAATKFGCTVVLKGSRTVVANADGKVNINPTGNAGMATAGCGDVLSGIIGGLMAQGVPSHEAAVIGVYIHGMAGDFVAVDLGEAGIMAGDIENAIPHALLNIRQGAISHLEGQLLGLQ